MKYTKNINFRVTPEQKCALKALTKEAKMTSPGDYIRSVLFNGSPDTSEIEADRHNSKPIRVNLILPGFVAEGIRLRSASSGIPISRYISHILQTQLTEYPVLKANEISVLSESKHHLAKIGANIGQLTHHYNASRKAGNIPQFDPARYQVFNLLSGEIKSACSYIQDLIRSSKGVW